MAETVERTEAAEDGRGWADGLTTVLGLVLMNALPAWELLPRGEAMLAGFLVAFAVGYWIPPRPAEGYGSWMLWHIPLVLGVYLALFKIPAALKPHLPRVLAYAIPILAFIAVGYLIGRRRARRPQN